jgi:predicted ferric reductase
MSRATDVSAGGPTARNVAWGAGLVLSVTLSAVVTSALIGLAVSSIATDRMAPWILGRAAGITSYLLLASVVILGLLLSHPRRAQWSRPSSATRIRIHVSLSVFTLVFVVLHIVVLATDKYAGVGWWGSFVPMGSSYRPVAVTLGVIGLYAGLAAGLTAALAGRVSHRVWWPLHKVAIVSLILVWLHGVLAGIDAPTLMGMYVLTGAAVLLLAISRYVAKTSNDGVAELAAAPVHEVVLKQSGGTRSRRSSDGRFQ